MPDSADASQQDAELRAHVERALAATYEVEQEIGRGGMGIVYRARDKRLKRRVAIKLLPPELSFRRDVRSRFLREAETAAQLSHPNIVPIYSVDEVENLVFFVMACVDGDNLATKLRDRGPLPIEDVRRVLTEVADALAYAHQRGVIHRDIKPDNILMDSVDGRALVTDFGIARAASGDGDSARLTATGIAIGTPAYMSPEQASGERDVDGRSDLYSLGIVAYQMLVGEPPFVGTTTPALLVKHLAETPVPVEERRSDIPPELAQIVMRLLQKAPEHRFQTSNELAQSLRSGVVPPTPAGTPDTLSKAQRNAAKANQWSPPVARPTDQRMMPGVGMADVRHFGDLGESLQGHADSEGYVPTAADYARWDAAPVKAFRKKLAPYLFVNAVIVFAAIFADNDLLFFTTIWSIFLAFKYAKLWSDGYDWRDVLHQPRHRLFGEVVSDFVDGLAATFSRKRREELRAKGHLRGRFGASIASRPAYQGLGGGPSVGDSAPMVGASDELLGEYAVTVRRARADRDEITRLLGTIPPAERSRIPEVAKTAATLVSKIETIAVALAQGDRDNSVRHPGEIDAEIQQLESEANPFDTERSETRVRRLALLRRERRSVIDSSRRRDENRGRLESCRLALENVRLDLVRLRTGNSSVQSVTLIAEQALALAREIDLAVSAASEVRELTKSRSSKSA